MRATDPFADFANFKEFSRGEMEHMIKAALSVKSMDAVTLLFFTYKVQMYGLKNEHVLPTQLNKQAMKLADALCLDSAVIHGPIYGDVVLLARNDKTLKLRGFNTFETSILGRLLTHMLLFNDDCLSFYSGLEPVQRSAIFVVSNEQKQ